MRYVCAFEPCWLLHRACNLAGMSRHPVCPGADVYTRQQALQATEKPAKVFRLSRSGVEVSEIQHCVCSMVCTRGHPSRQDTWQGQLLSCWPRTGLQASMPPARR